MLLYAYYNISRYISLIYIHIYIYKYHPLSFLSNYSLYIRDTNTFFIGLNMYTYIHKYLYIYI